MIKLELNNCTNFQSGTALNIRKYCSNLQYLKLEIDSTDGNSNFGLQEALQEQNIHTLENQVGYLYIKPMMLMFTDIYCMQFLEFIVYLDLIVAL